MGDYYGCGDSSCVFGTPAGMHTNGGCQCLQPRMTPGERARVSQGIRAAQAKIRELKDALNMRAKVEAILRKSLDEAQTANRTSMCERDEARATVESLQRQIRRMQTGQEIESDYLTDHELRQQSRIDKLETALRFYADRKNWEEGKRFLSSVSGAHYISSNARDDEGQRARAALDEEC